MYVCASVSDCELAAAWAELESDPERLAETLDFLSQGCDIECSTDLGPVQGMAAWALEVRP